MSFKFDPKIRSRARERDSYLVGVDINSPVPRQGFQVIHQTPALSKTEASDFSRLCVEIFSRRVSPADVLEMIESAREKA